MNCGIEKRVQELAWIINHGPAFWHGARGLATHITVSSIQFGSEVLERIKLASSHEVVPRNLDPL